MSSEVFKWGCKRSSEITHKLCTRCKEDLPVERFHATGKTKKGFIQYTGMCKECLKIYQKERDQRPEVKERRKLVKKQAVKNGYCRDCRKKIDIQNSQLCSICKEKKDNYRKTQYYDRKEKGICVRCGCRQSEIGKSSCNQCINNATKYWRNEEHRKRGRERNKRLKDEIFNAYGGYKCACCGETEKKFLTLDHINNNGAKERREIGNNGYLFRHLKNNNFPSGYQVLCFNCNSGRQLNNGICPHEESKIKMYTFEEYIGVAKNA